ncbi:hypothetical protein M422DRAFT_36965 [Sphaerobolus stellatus SS14]|uniref:Uncharacterized protein n=1 Tax=Sphaerobolus stellatus (strain SS14) TaxID=990650 RepID=A0A0C9U593_SPHS4|nr:hypothetical protein M422DRAFT_36965 [Sphaerobolus stellatus SS14]
MMKMKTGTRLADIHTRLTLLSIRNLRTLDMKARFTKSEEQRNNDTIMLGFVPGLHSFLAWMCVS